MEYGLISGRITTEGDLELTRTVLSSQYYLLSSLPFPELSARPESLGDYCGLSPGSLAYGGLAKDYQVVSLLSRLPSTDQQFSKRQLLQSIFNTTKYAYISY